jgi:hypothetical protein
MTDSTISLIDELMEKIDLNNMYPPTKTYTYELVIPEEVHWKLVALGAADKQHHEDYAEQFLINHANASDNTSSQH